MTYTVYQLEPRKWKKPELQEQLQPLCNREASIYIFLWYVFCYWFFAPSFFSVWNSVLRSPVLLSINSQPLRLKGHAKASTLKTHTKNKLLPRNIKKRNWVAILSSVGIYEYVQQTRTEVQLCCLWKLTFSSNMLMATDEQCCHASLNQHLLWALFFHYKPVLPVPLSNFPPPPPPPLSSPPPSLPPPPSLSLSLSLSLHCMTHPTPCC